MDINTRHRVGAHGGVEPFTSEYESIFQRLGATVRNERDERQMLRNDLMVRGGLLGDERAVRAMVFRTWQTSTFGDLAAGASAPDNARFRDARTGGMLEAGQRLPGGPSGGRVDSLFARASFWTTDGLGHLELEGGARGVARGLPVAISAGLTRTGGQGSITSSWHPVVGVRVGAGGRTAELRWQPLAPAPADARGFLSPLEALSGRPPRILTLSATWTETRGVWSLAAAPWLTHSDQLWLRAPLPDDRRRAEGVVLTEGGVSTGISFVLGYRMRARRGVYAWVNPVWQQADAKDSAARAWERALPRVSLSGRAGLRTLLFLGDLDLDAFVRVRTWEAFGGRGLHTSTGLLLPRTGADRDVPASTVLDFVAEGGVRGATLFLAYENVLSGTNIIRGNLIVPDYPLPEQQVRFGVLWPIRN